MQNKKESFYYTQSCSWYYKTKAEPKLAKLAANFKHPLQKLFMVNQIKLMRKLFVRNNGVNMTSYMRLLINIQVLSSRNLKLAQCLYYPHSPSKHNARYAAYTDTCFAFSNFPEAAYELISAIKICFVAWTPDCFISSQYYKKYCNQQLKMFIHQT